MWSAIKDLLPKDRDSGISTLVVNGQTVTDPSDISNAFNSFFIDTGVKLAKSIPTTLKKTIDFLRNFMPNIDCRFHFKEVTVDDVTRLLNNLPSDKATGLDHISGKLLKHSAPVVARSLAHIFNKSLRNGRFPTVLKQASAAPIFKKM